ncbi:acyl-CoA dehydrogenase family protein [Micromonospora eburnea]|uniref:Methoxymalonate biosynthesis protein n=1 Tax=Micromonospora eburnea TaxID=227316 RepID=A0A1C6UIV8_9ACTN|nr:acyl-CoA dehydrogenase family protein [Micromonospora eburnea]SCL53901.1 methoxymalonate biosynthesis protein [Micromonospora eburnea]
MGSELADGCELIDTLVSDQAGAWDVSGRLPEPVLRELGSRGLLSAQVPTRHGGLELSSLDNGELTAHVGSRCSSLRSVMTSQGMVAWTIARLADQEQQDRFLPMLVGGRLAAVGFSEPDAGSDLSAISTEIRRDGDDVVLTGHKVWVTAAAYADLLVIIGRYGDGAAAVVVPTSAVGVGVEPVANPLGCRAAGHAAVTLDAVRVPAGNVLGGHDLSLPLLVTTALAYGRISVAWGCVGILRACLRAATAHATAREQFGKPLAEHQLVARHLADLWVAEQVAARTCEHASRSWDLRSPDMVPATILAKHVSATNAAKASATAVQVLASSSARDGHVVARAYRDAKLMEIIEGTSEVCQLILAEHALTLP